MRLERAAIGLRQFQQPRKRAADGNDQSDNGEPTGERAGIALATAAFQHQLEDFRAVGGLIGISVSSAFLLIIAAINVVILVNVYKAFQRVKSGGS